MARLGRYFLPEQPLPVIQRGNNRQAIFFDDEDYARSRAFLIEAARMYGCAVHAYVPMTNHMHLLVTPSGAMSLPRMMQSLGRRYVRGIDDASQRTGTLWEGRYRAAPIDSDAYFLACCRYIELNPVRARMTAHPGDYPWSSYRAHANGVPDPLVSDHDFHHPGHRRRREGLRPVRQPNDAARLSVAGSARTPRDQAFAASALAQRPGRSRGSAVGRADGHSV